MPGLKSTSLKPLTLPAVGIAVIMCKEGDRRPPQSPEGRQAHERAEDGFIDSGTFLTRHISECTIQITAPLVDGSRLCARDYTPDTAPTRTDRVYTRPQQIPTAL